ncbi:MAG: 23S rRNA (adenine(1618)-N(6))-methyltransferase RlmF [Vicinamibacteria bacterium]
MIDPSKKDRMHPRNRFRAGYDFARLMKSTPDLAAFVKPNAYGNESINYFDPLAVKTLNRALLRDAYGLTKWDIPAGYLCPPIPGRSDYLHYAADLLSDGRADAIPRGPSTRVLDVGMGANCIYPLIGAREYGWSFVGTEIDREAVSWAQKTVASNPSVNGLIACRFQPARRECFKGVIEEGEVFALVISNPPFHGSAEEAAEGNARKRRNLSGSRTAPSAASLNFGGQSRELWCPGGELGFVMRMIRQSVAFGDRVGWFTTLVSKGAHLPRLHEVLAEVNPMSARTIEMAQGQKQSRLLAWTFARSASIRASSIRASRTPARSRD